jgi:hypothetical protein
MKILAFTLIAFFSTGSLTTKDKLRHNWKISGTEEFNSLRDVEEKNKKNYVNLLSDGNYDLILGGDKKAGSYTLNEQSKTINFKDGSPKFFLKLKALSDTALVVESQHPSLVRTTLHCKIIK